MLGVCKTYLQSNLRQRQTGSLHKLDGTVDAVNIKAQSQILWDFRFLS